MGTFSLRDMSQIFSFLASMIPGTFFLGVNDVVIKKILREKIPEGLLLGVVWAVSGTILSLISLLYGYPEIKPAFWTAFGATVALNIFGQLAWFKAFKREEVSLIAPLRLLIPPLVLITGFLILRESPSLAGTIGVLITVSGLWFLLGSQANFTNRSLSQVIKNPGVLWGLAGAFSFSLSFPFDKQAVINSSALFFAGAASLLVGVANLFITLASHRGQNWPTFKDLWLMKESLVVNVLCFTAGVFLVNYALNFALAAYASSTKRLQVFWTILLSGRILKEGNIAKKLLAAAVMLLGIIITVLLG